MKGVLAARADRDVLAAALGSNLVDPVALSPDEEIAVGSEDQSVGTLDGGDGAAGPSVTRSPSN